MDGAASLVGTLIAGGIEVCFANPGTSEIHIVAALDRVAKIRCVLGLFEGVVTGAADGYARMADKPASTLLHLGPGLANGLANLHNASRAQVPIINVVGQHATYHLRHDTPLTSDIEAIARPYSKWVRTSCAAPDLGRDAAEAIIAAGTGVKLLAPYPFTRMQRGAGIPTVERVHYILEQAVEQLKDFRQLILVGAPAPVAYFAAPGKNSVLTPAGCEIHTLAGPD